MKGCTRLRVLDRMRGVVVTVLLLAPLRGHAQEIATPVAAACVAAQTTFVPLGDLPGGITSSEAIAISDDGCVVVGESSSASGQEAFRWQDGVMTGLGDLEGGAFESGALGASADGAVIVGRATSADGERAARWSDGAVVELVQPIELEDERDSIATAVSDDGGVVVGSRNHISPCALRWVGDEPAHLLGPCVSPYQTLAVAWGVSALGDVVVGVRSGVPPRFGPSAFRWEAGVLDFFGNSDFAYDVSSDGSTAVGSGSPTGGASGAARWSGEDVEPVGIGSSSRALGVSADGSVVVGSADVDEAFDQAFLWDRRGGTRLLEALLESQGVVLDGWTLLSAEDVSADGRSIVGKGINPQGLSEGWLVRMPEPGGVELFALATLACAALRREEKRARAACTLVR